MFPVLLFRYFKNNNVRIKYSYMDKACNYRFSLKKDNQALLLVHDRLVLNPPHFIKINL